MWRGRGAEGSRYGWLAAIVVLGLGAGWLIGALTASSQAPGPAYGAAPAPADEESDVVLPSVAGELARIKALLPVVDDVGIARSGRALPATRLNVAAISGGALTFAPPAEVRSGRAGTRRPADAGVFVPGLFGGGSSDTGAGGRSSGTPSSGRPSSGGQPSGGPSSGGPSSGGPSSGGSGGGTAPGGGSAGGDPPDATQPPSGGGSPGEVPGETPSEQPKHKAPASCDRPQGSKSPRCP